MIGYKFLPNDRKCRHGDGREVVVGETLKTDKIPILCYGGFHASPTPLNALCYAPGSVAALVDIEGDIVNGANKFCGRRQTCLAIVDAEEVLCDFVRACARDVLHLWDAPDVVVSYLESGYKSLRAAAREEGWNAVEAARAAARFARVATQADKNKLLTEMLQEAGLTLAKAS